MTCAEYSSTAYSAAPIDFVRPKPDTPVINYDDIHNLVLSLEGHVEADGTWFPAIGSSFHIGIDGISLAMLLLTTILTPLSCEKTKPSRVSAPAAAGCAKTTEHAPASASTAHFNRDFMNPPPIPLRAF